MIAEQPHGAREVAVRPRDEQHDNDIKHGDRDVTRRECINQENNQRERTGKRPCYWRIAAHGIVRLVLLAARIGRTTRFRHK